MNFTAETIRDTIIVTIMGELDDHTTKNIRDYTLHRKEIKNLIFDLSGVTFMDSAAIGLLVGRYKQVAMRSGRAGIVAPAGSNTVRLLKMSGVADLFTFNETVSDAKKNLKGASL
jgi:stage II sporulation protein AA (anti-sigma F factor antagonist)